MNSSLPNFIKYGSLFALLLFIGCDKNEDCTGTAKDVFVTTVVSPSARDFYLATPANDSAILSKACPVTFQFEYGYYTDSIQAKAKQANALDMPLTNLKSKTLFHVDYDYVTFQENWHVDLNVGSSTRSTGILDYRVTASDHGNYSQSTRGIFYIKTSLLSTVKSIDSAVKIYGSIEYYSAKK